MFIVLYTKNMANLIADLKRTNHTKCIVTPPSLLPKPHCLCPFKETLPFFFLSSARVFVPK